MNNPTTVFLGAEGLAELDNSGLQAWYRSPTHEEVQAFADSIPRDKATETAWSAFERLGIDGIGRPYFAVVITDEAPDWARELASKMLRVKRLEK